ncbi:hypothetical protein SLS62_007495 [Diatrype stigma]|uniref:Uncharacterized protein n=1 Tax=Diatrype stigma TaxID=117547 RepID=A0AAN9UL69_9PEZI
MAGPSSSLLWTLILLVTAIILALIVLAQILSTYTIGYLAAPREIAVFVDAIEFSIQENESYDRDVVRVQRLDDKIRLGRLLREIQRGGDDLREELNRLLIHEGGTALRTSARIMWASHRKMLEDRVRRLDLLRTRFLVVYMGIIAATVTDREKEKVAMARMAPLDVEKTTLQHYPYQQHQHQHQQHDAHRPKLPKGMLDSLKKKHSLTKIKTQPMGHTEKTGTPHRSGWAGVVQELQRSPILARRHASIEQAMAMKTPLNTPVKSPPMSPPLSPLQEPLCDSPLLMTPSPKPLDL